VDSVHEPEAVADKVAGQNVSERSGRESHKKLQHIEFLLERSSVALQYETFAGKIHG
jgi:hypothetical protein